MAQVDFYVLPENGKQKQFACALIQKAWKQGNKLFVNTGSEAEATTIDDMLWTFNDISFLPHSLASDESAKDSPIVIGHDNQAIDHILDHTPVMLNMTDQIPANLDKVERILEIVAGSEDERKQARKRYAEYRDQGHEMNSHQIDSI